MELNLKNVYAADLWSRAIDLEDEEDVDEPKLETRKSFDVVLNSNTKDGKVRCDKLLISAGNVFSNYLDSCLYNFPNGKLIGNVVISETLTSVNPIYDVSGTSSETIYGINADKITDDDSYHWTVKVIEHLCSQNTKIFVISNESLRAYKCTQPIADISTPIVKYLNSSNVDNCKNFSPLEQPNIIHGLPAQILIQSEFNGMRCVVYVMYHDLNFQTSFLPLFFKKVDILKFEVDSEKLKQFEKKTRSTAANSLYI